MLTYETSFRVRYAETDQMGVVYHANYVVWMEIGRTEYCRNLGVVYRDLELNAGVGLAVAEVHCRYIAPARYDDLIVVETGIVSANARVVQFGYRIREETENRLLATGETKHVFCTKDMKPTKLPEEFRGYFGIAR